MDPPVGKLAGMPHTSFLEDLVNFCLLVLIALRHLLAFPELINVRIKTLSLTNLHIYIYHGIQVPERRPQLQLEALWCLTNFPEHAKVREIVGLYLL